MSFDYPKQQPPDWRNPYAAAPDVKQPKRWIWVIISLVGLGTVGLALCCGGGLWLMSFGFSVATAEVEDKLRDNPRVQEHIGEIQEFTLDWTRSFSTDDEDTFIYRIKGNKAAGKVTVKHVTNDDGKEEIVSASLRLDSGKTVELVP